MATTSRMPVILSSSPVSRLSDIQNGDRRESSVPLALTLSSPSGFLKRTSPAAPPHAPGNGNEPSKMAVLQSPALECTSAMSAESAKPQGRKRKRASVVTAGDKGEPKSKPRKRVAKAKELDGDGQPVKPKAKRRKRQGDQNREQPAVSTTDTVTVSRHFPTTSPYNAETGPMSESHGLGISAAAARRRSWTPVRDSAANTTETAIGADGHTEVVHFAAVVNSFGYEVAHNPVQTAPQKAKKPPTTKKKLEGVDGAPKPRKPRAPRVNKDPKAVKLAKPSKAPKAPKALKLPRAARLKTVTDFAISAYRKPVEATDPSQVLLSTSTQLVHLADNPTRTLEPGTKGALGERSASASMQFQFPAPSQARQNMRQQDFLFGTSSQLAKDESPSTHRMIQQAIRDSEDMAYGSQSRSSDVGQSPPTSKARVASAPHGTVLGGGERNLWAQAARDENDRMFAGTQGNDSLHQAASEWHVLGSSPPLNDPLGSPCPEVSAADALAKQAQARSDVGPAIVDVEGHTAQDVVAADERHDSGFIDISELARSPHAPASSQPVIIAEREMLPKAHTKQPVITVELQTRPTRRPVLQVLDVNSSPVKPEVLHTGLAFKPTAALQSPKRRVSAEAASKEAVEQPHAIGVPEKRPRGRPRKDSTAKTAAQHVSKKATGTPKKRGRPRRADVSWFDIDEISDSEASASAPSPPRRSLPSSPKTLELSSDPPTPAAVQALDSADALVALPRQAVEQIVTADALCATVAEDSLPVEEHRSENDGPDTAVLFATITRTVKAAPRSNDLSGRPSWYEKMLMYDPIVLEDLTAWLVEQGVKPDGTVDTDPASSNADTTPTTEEPTVDPDTAQAGKPRAKATKRKGKGKAKAKQAVSRAQERASVLQPVAVRAWCEANSICCLWREGLRGGVRKAY